MIPRLERCLIVSGNEAELTELIYLLTGYLDQMFTTEMMSEEHAISIVSQHVTGPSFLKKLLLGEKFDLTDVDEIFIAVRTLAHVWEKRDYVSKLAAGALISTQYLPVPAIYTEKERQEIQRVMEHLNDLITKCWEQN